MLIPWVNQLLLFGNSTTFSPKSLSGLVIWLRGDASSITLNGSNVANWADQSGNGKDVSQSNATKQPLYTSSSSVFNNKPCIRGDGINDVLESSVNVWPGASFSLFAVLATVSGGTGEFFSNPSVGGDSACHFYGATETTFQRFNGVSKTLTSQTKTIVTYTVATANETLSLNGGTEATGSSAPTAVASKLDLFGVGATPLLPRSYDLAEFILYDRVLSSSEKRYVQLGLATRYAITLS